MSQKVMTEVVFQQSRAEVQTILRDADGLDNSQVSQVAADYLLAAVTLFLGIGTDRDQVTLMFCHVLAALLSGQLGTCDCPKCTAARKRGAKALH
ncbi:hypothetical protein [Palleronia pelagia]|uniref:Uncharacterized protein n=1 Tax=Palleronia pelagia TaxID=387096 RepID=A0A1H8HXL2_9RHOB|nr:hypothetical protein [Palleronia pelagia]SEN61150.1 hypothetical protein SAMN04488011_10544 [Palleronia pelagia]